MSMATITLEVPESLYDRLLRTATAMQQPIQAVIVRALTVGSPPSWDDVPEAFRADLARLDEMEDEGLWQLAQGKKAAEDLERYDDLLEVKQERSLSALEQDELEALRVEADRFMLCKAHAAALLRWRGHVVQPL